MYLYMYIYICRSPAILKLVEWKPDWLFTTQRMLLKIVSKKSFNIDNRRFLVLVVQTLCYTT